ncbi:MAG: SDR family NAD(P)-dependent oxidoreductase [Armatimonadetes bacterium]|nr:SDR family NAD(P)-dependent oxidoreductase [Armatimonadota bacterium]
MSSPKFSRAIVVGASSGIGAELVRQLASSGTVVAALGRRMDRLEVLGLEFPELIHPFQHDVTDFRAIPALFQDVTLKLGGLDAIFYVAGVMPEVASDEFNFEKDLAMIQVNDAGAVAWLNQAAMRFAGVGAGTIVGISSVAGDRGRAGQPVYNASKAFLTTYLEALRNRLIGVTVVTIKPGPVQSEMTAHLPGHDGFMPASVAAELILRKSSRSGEHYLKLMHRLIFLILRNIPSPIFRRLNL